MSAVLKPTEDGVNWIIEALDPFHDFQMKLSGFPDLRSGSSLVQMHNSSFVVGAPASAGGGNWDCHLVYTGFDSVQGIPTSSYYQPNTNAVVYDHANPGPLVNSLVAIADAAGVPCTISNVTGSRNHEPSFRSQYDGRLIAVGIEVHNTTASMFKQGSVTVAQLSDVVEDNCSVSFADSNAAPWSATYGQGDLSSYIPESVAELRTIPQAQTWDAAKGVYMVPRMVSADLKPHNAFSSRTSVFRSTSGPDATIPIAATLGVPHVKGMVPSGFAPMSAYFTGLSNESTLTVTFRTIVEYFPPVNTALIPLATPSPVYDPAVLSAYTAAAKTAPYAVQVSMNAAGDYFRMVFNALQRYAPAVAALIPHPLGKFVGGGLAAVGYAGNGVMDALAARKKPGPKQKGERISRTTAGGKASIPTRK